MRNSENIWSFETANFRAEFNVAPDDDLDLSWDDDGLTREGLESGKYVAFVAEVRVIHKATGATLGADYLSGCIYESAQQFRKETNGYFDDMIHEAVASARREVAKMKSINLRAVKA